MFRPRRYLSGLDWIIQAMNSSSHRCGPTGNSSQIVLEFDRPLDQERVRATFSSFVACFPMLAGHTARPWTLEPHWFVPPWARLRPPRVETIPPEAERDTAFAERANQPFRHRTEYLALHLHNGSDGSSALMLTFDHRILDARGAEQFLEAFLRFNNGELSCDQLAEADIDSRPTLLNEWAQRFESGRTVRKVLRDLTTGTAFSPLCDDLAHGPSRFLRIALSRDESRAFLARAEKEAGFMMFMPYALAAAASAYAAALCPPESGQNFLVPCTIDTRGSNPPLAKLFFNYCAMLFFRLDNADLHDRSRMIQSIKQEFYEQRKVDFPRCFEHVMALMRILPVRVLDAIICHMRKARPFSFAFASLGVSATDGMHLDDAAVVQSYHLPHVPPHVGIGFFYTQCNHRITLTVSAREGLLTSDQRRTIERVIREQFATPQE